jgi:hypothetical protein
MATVHFLYTVQYVKILFRGDFNTPKTLLNTFWSAKTKMRFQKNIDKATQN